MKGALKPACLLLLAAKCPMKKSKTDSRKCQKACKDPAPAAPLQTSAAELPSVQQQISAVVIKEAMAMVTATIDQVKEGHFQAMKFLFEMVGLFPATATPEVPQDSLGKTFLARLGMLEKTEPDETVSLPGGVTPSPVE
jgi:hypothetical protein